MTDPFTDVADELMTRSTDSATTGAAATHLGTADSGNTDSGPSDSGTTDSGTTDMGSDFPAAPAPAGGAKTKKHVCPYCGAVTNVVDKPTGPCPRCSMDDTPATRAATKSRIGPWYVLQSRNPSAPGMKWATLLSLVSKGQVTPRSIVRGPTTHQLWKFAAHVKGLSREFNLCYSCGGEIEKTANQCIHCDRLQEPPVNPDTLLETRDIAAAAGPRVPVQREIRQAPGPMSMQGMSIQGVSGQGISGQRQSVQSAPSLNQPTDLVIAGSVPAGASGAQDEMRRPRNPDDGILSAKELAAAFQLDFNPQVEPTMPASPVAHKPPRVFKTLVVLIFLAAIGAGAAIYVKPEYRAKATTWMNQAFASSKHYLASTTTDKKSSPSNSTADKTSAEKISADKNSADKSAAPWDSSKAADSSAAAPTTPSPATPADSAPTNSQAAAPLVTSAPNPPTPAPAADHSQADQAAAANPTAPQNPAPSTPSPAVAQQNPSAPATPPQQDQSASAAQAHAAPQQTAEERVRADQAKLKTALDTPNASELSLDQQHALENTLYYGAIDAEVANDLPLAVNCYNKIMQLDKSVRHTDVPTRLQTDTDQLPH